MKSLAGLSVKRPVTTIMVLVSLLVLGAISFARLPLAFLPEVDFPAIFITIPYPNSSPAQIEKEIVKPLEEALATLSGVRKMSSSANADEATLQLDFNWGDSLDVVRMKVAEKVEEIRPELPADIQQIFINTFSTSQIPVVEARISAPGIDLSQNYDLLEKRVVNPLQRVAGVAKVELNGVEPREVRINLRLNKIAAHGVDIGTLAGRLASSNLNLALGKIDADGRVIHVRSFGAFADIEAILDFPVGDRGLKVADIAYVTYQEPPIFFGRHLNGDYAVALQVYKDPTANTVDVATQATALIRGPIASDPTLEGIQLLVFQDQAGQITNGLNGLRNEGLIGGLLAIVVLYFFLRRFDTTFIVSLAIPMSIISTAVVLYFMDKTLNVLSMMGLMLGVGLLVDDAIVVLESIFREHTASADASKAAITGTRQVVGAVVASTVTTAIVFLPLVVGDKNELTTWLGEIGLAISLTIFCSLIVSMTLIPLMASKLLSRRQSTDPRWTIWLTEKYVGILHWTFRHRWATFGITLLILASIALPFTLGLQTAMFAGINKNRMYLQYDFSDFHYKEDAEAVVSRVEQWFFERRDELGLESVYSYFAENEAGTTLSFVKEDIGEEEAKTIRKKMREGLPKLAGVRIRFDDEDADVGGSSTTFRINLYGEDNERLTQLARDTRSRLSQVAGIEDAKSSVSDSRKEIQVVLNRELAAKYGLTPRDVAEVFTFTLGGQRLRKFNAGDKEVDLILTMALEDVSKLDDLRGFVLTGGGRGVTLGTLADFKVVEQPKSIRREDRRTVVNVRAVYEGENWNEAREVISSSLDRMSLPPGYSWSFGERIQRQDEQTQQMLVNYLLALLLVYIVMASQFESLAHPFAILVSIPFALWGAAWFLWATDSPFNLMGQIGVLILMGIVVKNGIVLIDHINNLRRKGYSREEAIELGGRERLRPILMTAATAVLALVPMAIGRTELDGLYYYPLARTVIGGLTASTFLTLVILPYIYVLFDNLAEWARNVWRASEPVGVVRTSESKSV
jgi:HAE1 family hydrophobic/amphiphilic exporter-1